MFSNLTHQLFGRSRPILFLAYALDCMRRLVRYKLDNNNTIKTYARAHSLVFVYP